jgi:two-component system CheB/CheR fusion protein
VHKGGTILVQEPLTAMHDGMPRAAISNGASDYVLPLSGIAQQLTCCASPSYVRPQSSVSQTAELTRALDAIIELVRKQAAFDLSGYRITPLLWRIQARMDLRRVGSFADYHALLRDDPSELEALIRGVPIHVTEFFRDPPAWEVISKEVIEGLLSESASTPQPPARGSSATSRPSHIQS